MPATIKYKINRRLGSKLLCPNLPVFLVYNKYARPAVNVDNNMAMIMI